jgi:hypothetical protein
MDKARYPHVMRTWRVERTKVPFRTPQPTKLPSHPFFTPQRRPALTPPPPVPEQRKRG